MNAPTDTSSDSAYAIKLFAADPRDPHRLAGRLEHVLSGRCHHFDDGQELLACLTDEQLLAALAAAARLRAQARARCPIPPYPDHPINPGRHNP